MKLMTLVPVTTVLLVGWVSGASAASLSIDAAEEVAPPEVEVAVAYSGFAEGQQSYLQISAVKDATACAPTHGEFDAAASALRTNPIVLPAGSFSGTAKLHNQGQNVPPGRYLVCAYLEQNSGNAPRVVASDSVTANPEKIAVRTYTSNLFEPVKSALGISLTSFPIAHGTTQRRDGEKFAATMQVLISPAVRSKHKLPSTVLMRGAYAGRSRWSATATKAVSKKLKRIKQLRATYRIRYTSPFTETVTRQVFLINRASDSDERRGLVYLSSSGDTWPPAIAGGPGAIGGGSDDGNGS